MTYQEAIEFKRQLGKEQISKDGRTLKVLVTPADNEDLEKYLTDYRGGGFTDNTSKKYSHNGQFKVHELWIVGSEVSCKPLS